LQETGQRGHQEVKSLRGVLEASTGELTEIDGIGPRNAFGIGLVRQVAQAFLKEKIIERPIYSSARQVFDYLFHSMRGLKKEVFKIA
jgi:DNA repair protein RadC